MSALATTDRLIRETPDVTAAAVRALVKTQTALKADPERAAKVGRKLFPADAAALIADLIRRDAPYYDASISREFVVGMNQFARDVGILRGNPSYESIVATQFADLWRG
jgi:ABC-type nitrate/sulfonate/bicarbonate transport system substrate-binding protein